MINGGPSPRTSSFQRDAGSDQCRVVATAKAPIDCISTIPRMVFWTSSGSGSLRLPDTSP